MYDIIEMKHLSSPEQFAVSAVLHRLSSIEAERPEWIANIPRDQVAAWYAAYPRLVGNTLIVGRYDKMIDYVTENLTSRFVADMVLDFARAGNLGVTTAEIQEYVTAAKNVASYLRKLYELKKPDPDELGNSLGAVRSTTRKLLERLPGKVADELKMECLAVEEAIAASEKVLPPIGLQTTLEPTPPDYSNAKTCGICGEMAYKKETVGGYVCPACGAVESSNHQWIPRRK
jgi:hypothetical protein